MHEPVRDPAMGSWPLSPPQLAPSLYEMLVDRYEETEELVRPESQRGAAVSLGDPDSSESSSGNGNDSWSSAAHRREEVLAMLGDHDVGATVAVRDFDAARSFNEGTLGLEPLTEFPDSIPYRSDNTRLMVYRSDFAGTNQATAATWGVGDQLDSVVQDLKSKGVTFEHYDLPDTTRDGDVHEMGDGMRGVWFKDPSGNIISVVNAT